MAYGMKLFDSMGAVTYDTSSQGGVFVEFATLPFLDYNTAENIQYTQLTGCNLYVIPLKAGDHQYKLYGPQDTVPGFVAPVGYPVIQYQQSSTLGTYGYYYLRPTILMVFAR
jgi:hypothetical protein